MAWLAAVAIVGLSVDASGQTSSGIQWQRGTTLDGFLGAASPASGTRAVAGTGLAWEITPHFTLEGRGAWLRHDQRSSDFFALLGALVPLLPARRVVPFASAGIGMYRATIDSGATGVPAFYQQRMAPGVQAPAFDDFMLNVGGGADVFLTSHLAVRPDVTVLVVMTRSDRRVMPVYGVHVAYHFEAHPMGD
ncbi:MAG TPA: hypothetical protein VI485_19290 [Vicinamibacterales bacterium]|nr:hypothetical protein [Vicinamibacterales bacterium]